MMIRRLRNLPQKRIIKKAPRARIPRVKTLRKKILKVKRKINVL
jgi:hypothetical protein